MNSRNTLLLAIGMLCVGVLIGSLTGGVAGYVVGQNARPAISRGFQMNPPAQTTTPDQTPVPNQPRGQQQQPRGQQQQPRGQQQPRSITPPATTLNVGAYVEEVEKDSPADKAGLKVDDVITAVGNTTLDANTALADVIKKYKPGDKVELTVNRSNQTLKLSVELGATTDGSNTTRLGVRYTLSAPNSRPRLPNN